VACEARAAIEAAIPHRDPFLFVERVLERSADRLVSEWRVAPELDCFRGHFPGEPLLPGVLFCEFAFQSAALLLADAAAPAEQGLVPMVTRIEDARFKKTVRPGETLEAEITVIERLGPARWCGAHVRSGGKTVLKMRFTVALASPAGSADGEGS
jgi:3-hydroxyacyl-[acyl-carrier-protein] dehydratase